MRGFCQLEHALSPDEATKSIELSSVDKRVAAKEEKKPISIDTLSTDAGLIDRSLDTMLSMRTTGVANNIQMVEQRRAYTSIVLSHLGGLA